MKQQAWIPAIALALCGGTAQAQSNEELKAKLDEALKTIQDLQGRVKALEQSKPATAPTAAPAGAAAAGLACSSALTRPCRS